MGMTYNMFDTFIISLLVCLLIAILVLAGGMVLWLLTLALKEGVEYVRSFRKN